MADFKFELDSEGVVELLTSAEMGKVLEEYGSHAASSAGRGYTHNTVRSGDRLKVFVKAETKEAVKDNLKNNTLLKVLGGGS